ncbi:hypothetical protein SDC9_190467 [bioreactor metagenome]|uniref:Uncharacterized protein n=1 Tax=bioreactor metagenome TaxID=1076179 RepID=A0A645HXJ0_9ZZZZ
MIVLTGREVHTCRESTVHVGFRVLRMSPVNAQVFRLGIGVRYHLLQFFLSGDRIEIVHIQVAGIFIPFTVIGANTGSP